MTEVVNYHSVIPWLEDELAERKHKGYVTVESSGNRVQIRVGRAATAGKTRNYIDDQKPYTADACKAIAEGLPLGTAKKSVLSKINRDLQPGSSMQFQVDVGRIVEATVIHPQK